MQHLCSHCYSDQGGYRCTGCSASYYCSTECQTKHYPIHQKVCRIGATKFDTRLVKDVLATTRAAAKAPPSPQPTSIQTWRRLVSEFPYDFYMDRQNILLEQGNSPQAATVQESENTYRIFAKIVDQSNLRDIPLKNVTRVYAEMLAGCKTLMEDTAALLLAVDFECSKLSLNEILPWLEVVGALRQIVFMPPGYTAYSIALIKLLQEKLTASPSALDQILHQSGNMESIFPAGNPMTVLFNQLSDILLPTHSRNFIHDHLKEFLLNGLNMVFVNYDKKWDLAGGHTFPKQWKDDMHIIAPNNGAEHMKFLKLLRIMTAAQSAIPIEQQIQIYPQLMNFAAAFASVSTWFDRWKQQLLTPIPGKDWSTYAWGVIQHGWRVKADVPIDLKILQAVAHTSSPDQTTLLEILRMEFQHLSQSEKELTLSFSKINIGIDADTDTDSQYFIGGKDEYEEEHRELAKTGLDWFLSRVLMWEAAGVEIPGENEFNRFWNMFHWKNYSWIVTSAASWGLSIMQIQRHGLEYIKAAAVTVTEEISNVELTSKIQVAKKAAQVTLGWWARFNNWWSPPAELAIDPNTVFISEGSILRKIVLIVGPDGMTQDFLDFLTQPHLPDISTMSQEMLQSIRENAQNILTGVQQLFPASAEEDRKMLIDYFNTIVRVATPPIPPTFYDNASAAYEWVISWINSPFDWVSNIDEGDWGIVKQLLESIIPCVLITTTALTALQLAKTFAWSREFRHVEKARERELADLLKMFDTLAKDHSTYLSEKTLTQAKQIFEESTKISKTRQVHITKRNLNKFNKIISGLQMLVISLGLAGIGVSVQHFQKSYGAWVSGIATLFTLVTGSLGLGGVVAAIKGTPPPPTEEEKQRNWAAEAKQLILELVSTLQGDYNETADITAFDAHGRLRRTILLDEYIKEEEHLVDILSSSKAHNTKTRSTLAYHRKVAANLRNIKNKTSRRQASSSGEPSTRKKGKDSV